MSAEKLEVLQTAYEYMPNLYRGIKEVATLVKQNIVQQDTYKSICEILEGLQWLVKAFSLTQDIQKEPIQAEKIQEIISDLAEAIRNEDNVLMADLFEYEIMPLIEAWYENLEKTLEV